MKNVGYSEWHKVTHKEYLIITEYRQYYNMKSILKRQTQTEEEIK